MAQPALGLVASAIVMAISLGFIALFDLATFVGWVSFFNLCLIPMQVVAVVLWDANPPFVARLRQPARGLALLAVTMAAAAAIAPLTLQAIGEGISPPGPIPSHFVIVVVPTAFFLAIMFGGWPFTAMFRNTVAAGLAVLIASYAITYLLFRVFFDYGFLQGTPAYLASAPAGLYNAVMALVFYVTVLAVMFLVLCFDLWPMTTLPGVMRQPALGAAWMAISLAGGALLMYAGVGLAGMDPMVFLTRVTAPIIFGTILVLNMLQGSLFAGTAQPLKGVLQSVAAIVAGAALAAIYGALAPMVTGALSSGPPAYDYEVWLANALLSVTFPFLIFHAVYLGYWPFVKPVASAGVAVRTQGTG